MPDLFERNGTSAVQEQIIHDAAGKAWKVYKNRGTLQPVLTEPTFKQYMLQGMFNTITGFLIGAGAKAIEAGLSGDGTLTGDSGEAWVDGAMLSVVDTGYYDEDNNKLYSIVQGSPIVNSDGTLSGRYKGNVKSYLTPEETIATITAAYDAGLEATFWSQFDDDPEAASSLQDLIDQIKNNDTTFYGVDDTIGYNSNGVVEGTNVNTYSSVNNHAKVLSWFYEFTHSEHYIPSGSVEMILQGAHDSSVLSISPGIYFQKKPAGTYTFDTYTITKNSSSTSRSRITRTTIIAEDEFLYGRFVTNLNPSSKTANNTSNGYHDILIGFTDDVKIFKKCEKTVNFSGADYQTYQKVLEAFSDQLIPGESDTFTDFFTHLVSHSGGTIRYLIDLFGYDPNMTTNVTDGQTIQDAFEDHRNSSATLINEFLPVFNEQYNYIGPGVYFEQGTYSNTIITLYAMLAEYSSGDIPEGNNSVHGNDFLNTIANLQNNPFDDIANNPNVTPQDWLTVLDQAGLNPIYINHDWVVGQNDIDNDNEEYPLYIPSPTIISPYTDPELYPGYDPNIETNPRKTPQTWNPNYPNSNLDPRINANLGELSNQEQVRNQDDVLINRQPINNEGGTTPNQPPNRNPNPTNTGIIPNPIIPSASASAMFNVHMPSSSQLSSFATYLWSNNFIDNLLKMFSDPMQAIVSLHQLYVTPSTSGNSNIICGYLDSGVSAPKVSSQFASINCGSIKIPKYYNNVMDNAPYTDLQLYLPFVGFVPLSNAECMGGTITVSYNIDVYSGQCVAHVKVEKDGLSAVLYQYGGNCSVPLPYSGGNWSQYIQTGIGVIAGAVAAGFTKGKSAALTTGITGAVVGGASTDTDVSRGGSFGQSIGALSYKKPYLIIDRRNAHVATYQPFGYGDNSYVKLSKCRGYVRIKEVNLSGIQATGEELREIEQLLKEGVII